MSHWSNNRLCAWAEPWPEQRTAETTSWITPEPHTLGKNAEVIKVLFNIPQSVLKNHGQSLEDLVINSDQGWDSRTVETLYKIAPPGCNYALLLLLFAINHYKKWPYIPRRDGMHCGIFVQEVKNREKAGELPLQVMARLVGGATAAQLLTY